MNTASRWFLIGLFVVAVAIPASAHHQQLRIQCVDYYPGPPDCCTAVSDSAGSGAHYLWSVEWGIGYMEPGETDVHYSHFNCNLYETGTDSIHNVVQGSPILGHGYAACYWP
jgi:hypothetical protein